MQVNTMIKEYNDKPKEPTIHTATTEMATFKDWPKCEVVARATILQGSEPTFQVDFMVVNNVPMFRKVLTLA